MASLMPHQTALLADGLTIPEAAMIQHNLVAVAHIYCNISVEHCAQLLDVAPGRVEATAATMEVTARLAAEACAAKWEETLARLHADFHGITSRVKAHAPCFPASLSPPGPEPATHLRPHV